MEVNSWFFRAMAHVRAIRGRSGISMEFMRMSAGGSSMLADLIADLKAPRQERLLEHSHRLLQAASGPGSGLKPGRNDSIVGTIVPANSAEGTFYAVNRPSWFRDSHPATASVDIFV